MERHENAKRVAVMVDGDNIGAAYADQIRKAATPLGCRNVMRVYHAGTQPCDWLSTAGYRSFVAGAGKNAADILLCIDAIEIAMQGQIDTFVIATSDGDFSHLAHRLRERGLHVLGLGEEKAPPSFRLACSNFLTLKSKAIAEPVTAEPTGEFSDFDQKIRCMIANHSKNGKGMRIVELAPKMSVLHGTRIGALPEKTWRSYLSKRPTLYDIDPRGPDAMVRYKTTGFIAH